MFHLLYADQSFDVVIVSNALHIVPESEKALAEIRRVLKDNGVLTAPTFTHTDSEKTKSVSTKTRRATTIYVSDKTIEKIIKLLPCAFKQAVRWEIIARNPFDNVILPKTEYTKRDIWTADMIRTALDQCQDSKLYVAMNPAFACSLRMGEILGLT